MGFFGRTKARLQGLLIRAALLLAAGAVLILAGWVNPNVGYKVLAGLRAPDSPVALVVSAARLLALGVGLWLISRGLR